MEIAIIGGSKDKQSDLALEISHCLEENSSYEITQYDLTEKKIASIDPNVSVVFIVVEDIKALYTIKQLAHMSQHLPMVVVSNHPQYALEGIRFNVKYYVLFPLERKEIREALKRSGVIP